MDAMTVQPMGTSSRADHDDFDDDDMTDLDDLSRRLREEALTALREEPELSMLLQNTVLAPGVRTFEEAVACTITYRLLLRPCHGPLPAAAGKAAAASLHDNHNYNHNDDRSNMMFCPNSLRGIIADALHSSTIREAGHTMSEAVRLDALAVYERDPAVDSILEVVLFLKGFAALVCHRAAYFRWHTSLSSSSSSSSSSSLSRKKKSMTALWLQSQASAVFGLDIHPAATIGAGVLLDHGTGIVIGETATVGDGCTLLHGVTLGGTGKQTGDRHPKVGRDVLIGANASLLGNIVIGDGSKIGAGSIVLRPIPPGATAVGSPAKIVGFAKEAKPASTMDETLQQVRYFHKSESSSTMDTVNTNASTSTITSVTTTTSSTKDDDAAEATASIKSDVAVQGTTSSSNTNDNKTSRPFALSDHAQEEHYAEREDDMDSDALILSDNDDEGELDKDKEDKEENNDEKDKSQATGVGPTEKSSNESKQLGLAAVKVHGKHRSHNDDDCCCPYRGYVRLSSHAPKLGNITFATLRRFLEPHGCLMSSIGELMLALDQKGVGFIPARYFFDAPSAREIMVRKTGLSPERLEAILADCHEVWNQDQARLTASSQSDTSPPISSPTSQPQQQRVSAH